MIRAMDNTPTKSNQSGASHHTASLDKRKGSNHTAKTSEDDAVIKYKNKVNKPELPLNGFGHDINLYKVVHVQSKSMKETWPSSCVGLVGCVKFVGDKRCLANSKYIHIIVASAMAKEIKLNRNSKSNDT